MALKDHFNNILNEIRIAKRNFLYEFLKTYWTRKRDTAQAKLTAVMRQQYSAAWGGLVTPLAGHVKMWPNDNVKGMIVTFYSAPSALWAHTFKKFMLEQATMSEWVLSANDQQRLQHIQDFLLYSNAPPGLFVCERHEFLQLQDVIKGQTCEEEYELLTRASEDHCLIYKRVG